MKAWYFSTEEKKLRHGDNRKIAIGTTHKVEGNLMLCRNGLHASKSILDAMAYAPGPIIWRVELSGKIIKGDNKCCASERTYLKGGIDISDVLRKFARMCALDTVGLYDSPKIVVEYLKTGRESLRESALTAARDARTFVFNSRSDNPRILEAARATVWAIHHISDIPAARATVWSSLNAAGGTVVTRKRIEKRLYRMVMEAIR